jgi:hypothetical protein
MVSQKNQHIQETEFVVDILDELSEMEIRSPNGASCRRLFRPSVVGSLQDDYKPI